MAEEAASIIATTVGPVGHIRLNRPRALNALSLEMIRAMDATLRTWRADDAVKIVVVSGEGERAFCAGGDVKTISIDAQQGNRGRDGVLSADFFREEYSLNFLISEYPEPYLAYLDGITMGGGVGISMMAPYRVASEALKFGMPETAIGFFPDVGGSFYMSRLGPIGTLLCLTGQTLDHRAALTLGIATHLVPRERGADLIETIASQGIENGLRELAVPLSPCQTVPALRALAERCFVQQTVEEMIAALERAVSDVALGEAAQQALDTLAQRSPTSLKVTLQQLQRGKTLSFGDCLKMEYRISQAMMFGHDFYEGIRAVLIDKDHQPRWSPDTLEQVDEPFVEKHFEELADRELQLP